MTADWEGPRRTRRPHSRSGKTDGAIVRDRAPGTPCKECGHHRNVHRLGKKRCRKASVDWEGDQLTATHCLCERFVEP